MEGFKCGFLGGGFFFLDFHVAYIQKVHEYPFEGQIPDIKDAD